MGACTSRRRDAISSRNPQAIPLGGDVGDEGGTVLGLGLGVRALGGDVGDEGGTVGKGGLGLDAGAAPTLGVGLAAAAVPTSDLRWPSRQPTSKVDALARASLASTMASAVASTMIQTTRLTAVVATGRGELSP